TRPDAKVRTAAGQGSASRWRGLIARPVLGCSAGSAENSDRRCHRRYLARKSHGIRVILGKKLCRQLPKWLPFGRQITVCAAQNTKRSQPPKLCPPPPARPPRGREPGPLPVPAPLPAGGQSGHEYRAVSVCELVDPEA